MKCKRPPENRPIPTNPFPDATEVAEIDISHLQPSWDTGCQIGSHSESRGTALFMEPSDTAPVIPYFMESTGDGPIFF